MNNIYISLIIVDEEEYLEYLKKREMFRMRMRKILITVEKN